ncbi:MliC family protein [Bartonella sp. B10]
MKKTLPILGFFAALSLLLFSSISVFAGSLVIEVPDSPEPTTKTVAYQCDNGTSKQRVEAIYLNAGSISLVDLKWKGERIIAANVIASSGTKYVGEQYIWWDANNEATLYDLINDPEQVKPINCKEESTLLF